MKKHLLIAALAATGLLCYTACRKESKTTAPVNKQLNNAGDFVNKYGPARQKFVLNTALLPQTITLAGGTKIRIPNGITVNGQAVSGDIIVEAIEVLKRSDVILGGTNTNTDIGQPLISKGFIYLDIKSNGVSADNALLNPLRITMAAPLGDSTYIWQGNTNVNGFNQLGWSQRGNGVKAGPEGFEFDFGNLGWVNCDILYGVDMPKTTSHVSLVNNPGQLATLQGTSGNTFVFFCIQGSNVAVQLYTPEGNGVKSYENSIPIGVTGKLLAFCIKDGHYYVAEKEIVTVNNQTDVLTLTETTAEVIQADIDALDNY